MLRINGILIEPIGEIEPVCPSCGGVLAQFPLRKVQCKHCGESIFSRTQPFDGQKRLINLDMAQRLEEQWAAFSKLKDVVAQFHFSEVMQAYLQDLRDGERGRASLHPSVLMQCMERLRRFGLAEKWIDPPVHRFDPDLLMDFVLI